MSAAEERDGCPNQLPGTTTGRTFAVMGVTKRSISLDDSVAARVEQAAEEDGLSFSAWLSKAADKQLRLREGMQGVREWEAEAGPLTPEEIAEGEALYDRLMAMRDEPS